MTWHYAVNDKQMGPVDQAELNRLVASGTIVGSTLIWTAGMEDWKPYAEVNPGAGPGGGPPVLAGSAEFRCAECGRSFAADEMVAIDGKRICAGCKPIVVQKIREGVVNAEAENIRNEHIKHEASIQSVGSLYLFGGVCLAFGSLALFLSGGNSIGGAGIGVVLLLFSALQFYIGNGLRKLKRPARFAAGIFAGIGLLGVPFGTIINGYILYLLFSSKGTTVFSDEYQDVIEQTPHIKYRTSIIVWIFLILLILLIVGGILAVVLGKK